MPIAWLTYKGPSNNQYFGEHQSERRITDKSNLSLNSELSCLRREILRVNHADQQKKELQSDRQTDRQTDRKQGRA